MVGTAYMTRGLQLVAGSSKRAIAERAEEMGHETDEIPMTAPNPAGAATPDIESDPALSSRPSQVHLADTAAAAPGIAGSTGTSTPTIPPDLPAQAPLPLPRAKQWAVIVAAKLDIITYLLLCVLVGIPVYYSTGYAMPIQLTFSILTYFGSLALPPTWRQFLHPVLVSAFFTVLGIWVIGLTIGRDLDSTLREYKVGANYARAWDGSQQLPGAGDMFSTVLDASIIALALPMYQYRRELKQHFLAIVIPNIVVSVASLFAYPWICFAIGITAERSLAFASRSLTLALAIPATANLGGDANTGAAVAIMSGIVGVLIGQRFLAWLRIPEGKLFSHYLGPEPKVLPLSYSWCQCTRRLRDAGCHSRSQLLGHGDGTSVAYGSASGSSIEPGHESVRRDYRPVHLYPSHRQRSSVIGWSLNKSDPGLRCRYMPGRKTLYRDSTMCVHATLG